MDPRNMPLCNGWPAEFELGQQMPNHHHQEPYILHGGSPNFAQPNPHQILALPGSIANFDFYHLPEHHNGASFYRMPQYTHQMHPATNLELGISSPPNLYNPYMNPAIGRMFSAPQNYGPSSAHVDGYGTNAFPPDDFRGLSKRNIAETSVGSIQYLNDPAAPSSSMAPLNSSHLDGGVAVLDACFSMPEYIGNFLGQSFQPPSGPNGVGDGSIPSFDPLLMSTYFAVSRVNANCLESGNVGGQRFHGGASTSQGSGNPLLTMCHPPHDFHHFPNDQGASRFDLNYHPPAAGTSSRHSIGNSVHHGGRSYNQQEPEPVLLPPGIRIYRSHRGSTPDDLNRHHDVPQLTRLPEEGLAILDVSGYYEMVMGSPTDDHRDMRLDIDYMSYEELIALSEQIGNVTTGLSDEVITAHLKTSVYRSSMATIDLEELPCNNETNDSCVICQEEYENGDKTGILDCGHEYHANCLKKWLRVKNACPICKSMVLELENIGLGRSDKMP